MKQKPISNDELARMVQRGFDETNSQISSLESTMREGFDRHDREFKAIRKQLTDIVYRREFEDLEERVKELENMLAMPHKKAA